LKRVYLNQSVGINSLANQFEFELISVSKVKEKARIKSWD
jgi:hypothetical protein